MKVGKVLVAVSSLSHVQLFAISRAVAHQAHLSMGFSRQEYWSGLPCPPPADLLTQGSNPSLLCLLHWRWILYHWATWEAPECVALLCKIYVLWWVTTLKVWKPEWLQPKQLEIYGAAPACVHAKPLQSCPNLCDPTDCSPPGSSVHGILQARILEWVAMPSSRGSFWHRDWTCVSYVTCIGRQVLYH